MAALTPARAAVAWAWIGLVAGCSGAPASPPSTPDLCRFASAAPEVDLVPHGVDGVAPRAPRDLPKLTVVIDDLGLHPDQVQPLWALGAPLTWAILPGSRWGAEYARWLSARGASVLVHQPMEPMRADHMTLPNFLRQDDAPETRRLVLTRALAEVPGAIGLNNHMGSRLTREPSVMREVVDLLPRDFVVLDSRTTRRSQLASQARGRRPVAERDVFLDNVREVDAIVSQLEQALRLAQARGHAVAIGHPYPETVEALRRFLEANGDQVELVPLERVSDPPVEPRWRRACRPKP